MYKSCINEELVNSEGEANFLQILDQYFGGWPILRRGATRSMSLVEKLVALRQYGFRPLLDIRVAPNPKRPHTHILKLKQPTWFFSKVYYDDLRFERAYKKYLLAFVTNLSPTLGDGDDDDVSGQVCESFFVSDLKIVTRHETRNKTWVLGLGFGSGHK